MSKKTMAVILAALFITAIIGPSAALGSDRPYQRIKERMVVPARLAPVYSFSGLEKSEFSTAPGSRAPSQMALGTLSPGNNPTSVGITYWDYQHNGTMGRQIEHRGTGYLSMDWMWSGSALYGGSRDIHYQAFNLGACTSDNHPPLFAVGGANATGADRAGYASLDVNWGNSCAIPAAHQNDLAGFNHPQTYMDLCSGAPFNFFSTDGPTTPGESDCGPVTFHGGYNYHGWYGPRTTDPGTDNVNIWPKIDWQIGTATVLHMVCGEASPSLTEQTISYYRRVGAYGSGAGVWSCQRVIDTVSSVNPTVTADRTSDKVAIVWAPQADYKVGTTNEYDNQYENDIWYAISTNQGAEWSATPTTSDASHSICRDLRLGTPGYIGGNITNYTKLSDWKAYADLSALITTDHKLHVVWVTRRWTDTTSLYRRQSALWHWSEGGAVTPIVKAMWDTGGTCVGYIWSSDVSKPSISECDGKLYVIYTQFGDKNHPCDHIGADK